jgi:RNA ligase
MFPIIYSIDDLLPHIKNKPEINVNVQSNGTTVVCYSIASSSTFDDAWARECRGITFDVDGKILARSLHKFFNVGEKEHTLVGNIDWEDSVRVMDKRDGSMITSMVIDGEVVCKTKKSFETGQALRAREFMESNKKYLRFARAMFIMGCTPTFEWTSRGDRIVLLYKSDNLVLTHLRNNITGEYLQDIHRLADTYDIPVVDDFEIDSGGAKEWINKIQLEENKEGYVVQFANGDMVKLKTPWYINSHHSVTFTRERDVARMVIEESIDDFKSYLTAIGESLDKVHAIENRVTSQLNGLRLYVTEFCKNNDTKDTISFVNNAKSDQFFGMIMSLYNGKDPQYTKYFTKHYLGEYSLETV